MTSTIADPALPRPRGAAIAVDPLITGPVLPTLVRLSLPNMAAMLATALVAMAETAYVGLLGTPPLAGLALVFPMVMLQQMMSGGAMGGGVSSSIARALGAGNDKQASALAAHAVIIGASAGLAFTVLFLLAGEKIYALLGGRGPALEQAMLYSNVDLSRRARHLADQYAGLHRAWRRQYEGAVHGAAGRNPGASPPAVVDLGLDCWPLPRMGMAGYRARAGAGLCGRCRISAVVSDVGTRAGAAVGCGVRVGMAAISRHPEGRRAGLRCAGAVGPDRPDHHPPCGDVRHRGAGRIRHRLAARVPADPDRLRRRRRLYPDGGHGHRRRQGRARAAGRMDRQRRGGFSGRRRWSAWSRYSPISGLVCSLRKRPCSPMRQVISPGLARPTSSRGWDCAFTSPRKARAKSWGQCWRARYGLSSSPRADGICSPRALRSAACIR